MFNPYGSQGSKPVISAPQLSDVPFPGTLSLNPCSSDSPPSGIPTRVRTSPGRQTGSLFGLRNLRILRGIGHFRKDDKDRAREDGTRSAEPLENEGDLQFVRCAPHLPGTQSTPTLLFPSSEDPGQTERAQKGILAGIRIPFLDDVELDRLRTPAREPRGQYRHQRHRQQQLSSTSHTRVGDEKWPLTSSVDNTARHGRVGSEMFEIDAPVRVSMISLGVGTLGNSNDHPEPLDSNPTQIGASPSAETQMEFEEIGIAVHRSSRPLSQVYDLNLDLVSVPSYPASACGISDPACRPPSSSPSETHDEAGLSHLQTTLGALLAANTALMTLKYAREQTIAHQETMIGGHKNSIAELSRQLQELTAENRRQAEGFSVEMMSRDDENVALRDERWALMSRVAELEQTVARMEALLRLGGQMIGSNNRGQSWVFQGDSSSVSDSGSALQMFSSPTAQAHGLGIAHEASPYTLPSSLPSPNSFRRESMLDEYAASPTPGGRSPYLTHQWRPRLPSQSASAEVEPAHSSRRAKLETDRIMVKEALAAVKERNMHLQEKVASQGALIQTLTDNSAVSPPNSAPLLAPDVPVLTYTTPGPVWLDRITTTFKYLGLLGFLYGDDRRPNPLASRVICEDWTTRRLHAAVLLKRAVDDAILEDVLYILDRRDNYQSGSCEKNAFVPSPATEDPHQLFKTILLLRRTVSSSPMDLSWVDRIDSADFDGEEGFERFASLVLCIDRRHSLLYGTSADHYEALLLRVHECMARLFPRLERRTLLCDPIGAIPRKRWQLTVWMAKIVRRRQVETC